MPHKTLEDRRAWELANQEKRSAQLREWSANNPEKRRTAKQRQYAKHRKKIIAEVREWRLRTKYGITPGEWEELRLSQGNACAICGKSFDKSRAHTDHNHSTGKHRSLLCAGCNMMIGFLESPLRPIGDAYIEAWEIDGEGTPPSPDVW